MKRTMSKITAILAIVFGSFGILSGLLIMSIAYSVSSLGRYMWVDGWMVWERSLNVGLFVFLLIMGIIILAFAIVQIVLAAKLLGQTSDLNKNPSTFNGLLIALVVLSFFGGSIITMVLGIVALCMNNIEDGAEAVAHAGAKTVASNSEFEQAVGRLKQYKADGIIDDATFKKKMDELFKKYYMN